MATAGCDRLLRVFSDVLTTLSRDGERDLTLRQLAVFLICCTEAADQTAKELSEALEVSAPAIRRVAERLTPGGLLLRVSPGARPVPLKIAGVSL